MKIEELFARAVYSSGTPLQIVENENWKLFFKLLRPAWVVPSRYKLSTCHLESEFNIVRQKVESKISESHSLGLMCDGWTNIRREPIINYVITTPEPIFYKTISTKAISHSGAYIAKEISSIIQDLGPNKVLGIVTDNAKSMKSAWAILKNEYDHLEAYGCVAHGLNLLAKDIADLKYISSVVTSGKNIVKEINLSHKLNAIFKEKQTEKQLTLKLPVKTRWDSHVASLGSILHNKSVLQSVAIDKRVEKILSEYAKKKLLSDTFWNAITQIHELLKPIADWITIIEGDAPQISLVPTIFRDIKNHLIQCLNPGFNSHVSENKDQIMLFLENRKIFCITSLHYAANILDPMLHGKNLTSDEELEGIECIAKTARNTDNVDEGIILAEFAQYKVKQGLWSKSFLWNTTNKISATAWWNGLCSSTQLSKIATRIIQLPATSAACERTFSTYGNIHTAKRNRLTNDRAGKLVYINHNLRLLMKKFENKPTMIQSVSSGSIDPVNQDLLVCSESEEELDINSDTSSDENHM